MKYTECYASQDDNDVGSSNCCTLPIERCDCCQRLMCQYHGSTFSHALTCRTPEENETLMKKYGLLITIQQKDIEIINKNGLLYDSNFMLNFPKIQTKQEMIELKQQIIQDHEIVKKIGFSSNDIYQECLETIYKIQFGKELDSWDSANLDTLERLLKSILENKK